MSARSGPRTEHLKPWRPGQSGNPLGARVKVLELVAEVRRRTKDGHTLVSFMIDVMEGRPLPVPSTGEPRPSRARYPQRPKIEHRLAAAQWLADRGWGKAKEFIELAGDAPATPEQRLALLRRLSDDERAHLRALLAKALATPELGATDARAPAPRAPDGAHGAPETLGRPRNVGRAVAPELDDAPLTEPDAEPESPVDPATSASP